MEVCDVERTGAAAQKAAQASWGEGLVVIGHSIRDIAKNADIQIFTRVLISDGSRRVSESQASVVQTVT